MSTQELLDRVAYRLLGRLLYILAATLGVAELGVMSRAGVWLSYGQIGVLNALYTFSICAGVLIAPRMSLKVGTLVSLLLAAVPIVGIGTALLTLPAEAGFWVACVFWPLSGVGAGMLDNVHTSQALVYSTRGRSDAVGMLGVRHVGTLSASFLAVGAVAVHLKPGWQYIILGVVLVVPVLAAVKTPDFKKEAEKEQVVVTGTGTWRRLFPVAFRMMAAVLPVSVSWATIELLMKELHASDQLSTGMLPVFACAQLSACMLFFLLSGGGRARALVLGGLGIGGVGVVLLLATAVQIYHPYVSTGMGQAMGAAGMALFGWGVGPLPMVVAGSVRLLPLLPMWDLRRRLALMVVMQCALVGVANVVFGQFAEAFTGINTYAATAVICVGVLVVASRHYVPKVGKAVDVDPMPVAV